MQRDAKRHQDITITLQFLAWILCTATLASICAKWHWIFDLFSHFSNQYMVGGLILAGLLTLLKSKRHAMLCIALGIFSFVETRLVLEHPMRFSSPNRERSEKSLTIVQYNHLITTKDFTQIQTWLQENTEQFDIIILQEASKYTENMAKSLLQEYPYQVLEGQQHTFRIVLLSKHMISDLEVLNIPSIGKKNTLIRVEIKTPALPLTLYTIHTMRPFSDASTMQRDWELSIAADKIANDPSQYIILAGDFNLTPTSPYFRKLKAVSKLNYQAFGIFQNPTWPSNHIASFLKIPIDHTLYNQNLTMLDRKAGPAFSSDHHALITTLAAKQ